MAGEGCEVVTDLTRRASMVGGPMLQPVYYIRQVNKLKAAIRDIRPDVFVPVDSPALNWHLVAAARGISAPVMYYIAPQVWAWAPWRVRKLARMTDHVACILPFEQRYLRDRGVGATYVGNPVFDDPPPRPDPLPDIIRAWSDGAWRVALLPGSRKGEIVGHTPALLAVGESIRKKWPNARCTFAVRAEKDAWIVRKACKYHQVEVGVGRKTDILAHSHFAVAASGTVTLEVAHFGVPMVVIHRSGPIMRSLYRLTSSWAFQTPHLSLVNILAGRRIVPELMPWSGKAKPVTRIVMEMLNDLGCLLQARQALLDVVKPLAAPGPTSAADNAAELVTELLPQRPGFALPA